MLREASWVWKVSIVVVEAMRTVGWRVEDRTSEREMVSLATLLRAMEALE